MPILYSNFIGVIDSRFHALYPMVFVAACGDMRIKRYEVRFGKWSIIGILRNIR